MIRARAWQERGGFSLLEMVVGLGLLAATLTLFATAEYAARRSTIQQLGRLDAQRDLTRTTRRLREDFGGCLQARQSGPGRTDGLVLALDVAGLTPLGDARPGVIDRILYERLPAPDGTVELVRRVEPAPGSDRAPERSILTRRLERLELQLEGRRLSVDLALRGSTGLVQGGSPLGVQLVLLQLPRILEEVE